MKEEIKEYEEGGQMAEEAKKERIRVLAIILLIVTLGLAVLGLAVSVPKTNVISESPLQNYAFYYSLDSLPNYKLVAAKMVDKMIAEGVEEDEACKQTISYVSDKIYEDTTYFYSYIVTDKQWADDNFDAFEACQKYINQEGDIK